MSKIKLRLYNLSSINYAGCQDCRAPNGIKEQLNKVDENIGKLLLDQTEARTGNTLQTVLKKLYTTFRTERSKPYPDQRHLPVQAI